MKYYQTRLATNDQTTQQVTDIIDSYKIKIKQTIKAKGLTSKQKSDQIDKLITTQNGILKAFLSPQQIQLMAPVFDYEKRDTVNSETQKN